MKYAKIWMIVLAVLCFAAGFGTALSLSNIKTHKHSTMIDKLSEKLNLTAEQRQKMEDRINKMKQDIQTIRQPIIEPCRKTEEAFINDLKAILNPDQQTLLEGMMQKREKKRDRYK